MEGRAAAQGASRDWPAGSDAETPRPWSGDYGFGSGDRRLAFSRQGSFRQHPDPWTPRPADSLAPYLARSASSISIPPDAGSQFDGEGSGKTYQKSSSGEERRRRHQKLGFRLLAVAVFRAIRSGNRPMKRLALMIFLNVAYSTTELLIGVFSGRVGLVSDAFHLTFGCGILTFSLFAMAASRGKPDGVYTYGYKRLEVLSAFTNALFLLFMSFSLAVEALHAFIQDESEHKHYLIVSAVTNLVVNLLGVWFFRSYARVNLVYRNAEDMNHHSVFLHVLADSIRSAGLILASWFLTLGVENAEVLCLGLVSVAIFTVVMPLFKATGSVLLQVAPSSIPPSALNKCRRQVKEGVDDYPVLQYVHSLYHDLGIHDLTVETVY